MLKTKYKCIILAATLLLSGCVERTEYKNGGPKTNIEKIKLFLGENPQKPDTATVKVPAKTAGPTKAQNPAENDTLTGDKASETLIAINASQYGMKYPETFILLQNRRGIRIEYNVDRSNLQLWISPQAGKSFSYVDQNWSNRDDFTAVIDRILLPGLNLKNFEKCDWDPFHSIIYFKNQTLHIAHIYDAPVVLVWFEKDGLVDFKIYGDEVDRSENAFVIDYTDRGRDFTSAAILGEGDGHFQHQLQLDTGRSVHARAHMAPGQLLVIGSELRAENIAETVKAIAEKGLRDILAENEIMIEKDLSFGKFTLRDRPEMQKLLETGRRTALSMQAYKGFMRSTNQYIYYLLWYRDGGMNVSHICYSGWPQPAYDNTKFALLNPNISHEDPPGRFFGQVMAGPITKWQEDGLFYVVWPAFSYWTQTGDKSLCQGEYLQVMQDAMDWLERRCFDAERGLFGRYHACETPMTNSRGDGYDQATGAPTFKWGSDYKGDTIVHAYDIYINALNYSVYYMLGMMTEDRAKSRAYFAKADTLEQNMRKFYNNDGPLPSYGDLLTIDGKIVESAPYGMDIWDYVWGLSLPPFKPNWPHKYKELDAQLLEDMTTTTRGYFLCVYFAQLTSMDTEIFDEKAIVEAMDKRVPASVRPGQYLPMPYAVPEMFNIKDGDPFHDVRPLVYSIAPWLSAVTNLGLRRLPFGVAVRGSNYLQEIDHYKYRDSLLNIRFQGTGGIKTVVLNGENMQGTYQIPENRLKTGENDILVKLEPNARGGNILIASTVQLLSMDLDTYIVKAHGKNILTFKNLDKIVSITDEQGSPVETSGQNMDNLTYVEFDGTGEFRIELE